MACYQRGYPPPGVKDKERLLYQFSRSIYRQLAPDVRGVCASEIARNRERLLRATESAMERLGSDPFYFARPTKSIFNEVRDVFPISRQRHAYAVIARHVALANRYVEEHARAGLTFDGSPRRCSSNTRKGKPCERAPLAGSQYCPSHQHLADDQSAAA